MGKKDSSLDTARKELAELINKEKAVEVGAFKDHIKWFCTKKHDGLLPELMEYYVGLGKFLTGDEREALVKYCNENEGWELLARYYTVTEEHDKAMDVYGSKLKDSEKSEESLRKYIELNPAKHHFSQVLQAIPVEKHQAPINEAQHPHKLCRPAQLFY